MSNYPFIFGARGGGGVTPFPVRWDYIEVSETQYIGFGKTSTTNSDIITIKRNVRNPSTGSITTAYATDTWTNHLTATYS